jgi:hypothetical protein
MSVGHDKLDPAQAAPRQAFKKARPERLGFRRADVQPDNLAPAVAISGHGDYCRHRNAITTTTYSIKHGCKLI